MDVLSDQDLYQKLLESSFRFVSFRPRSKKEVRDFLLKKLSRFSATPISSLVTPTYVGVQPSLIERVIARLRDLGYVDDAKFAAWWVDQRQSHKPKGARLIAQELKAKGISDDFVKTLLVKQRGQYSCGRNDIDTDDEVTLARRAIAKKVPLWQKLPKLEQKKKIYGFLGRRGFDTETIYCVVDEVARGEVE